MNLFGGGQDGSLGAMPPCLFLATSLAPSITIIYRLIYNAFIADELRDLLTLTTFMIQGVSVIRCNVT